MSERRSGVVVVLSSLLAFGLANADIEFVGVLDSNDLVTQIDSVTLTLPDTTLLTPGWGSHTLLDTFIFTGVTAWPETLRLYGTTQGLPVQNMLPHPKPDTWYHLSPVIPESPHVMFHGDYGVGESKPAVGHQPRLTVSPSVVTGLMTVGLQCVGAGRQAVQIHDAAGNVVRSLDCTAGSDGIATATWNREDEHGRLVAEGVYFCRYAAGEATAVRKVLVAR